MKHLFEFDSFLRSLNEAISVPGKKLEPKKRLELLMAAKDQKAKSPEFSPVVKLTEIKDLLEVSMWTEPIVFTYEDIINGTYDDAEKLPTMDKVTVAGVAMPIETPITGATYEIVNDNTMKFTLPEMQIDSNERVVISVRCPNEAQMKNWKERGGLGGRYFDFLVNPENGRPGIYLQNFDRPEIEGSSIVFHKNSGGVGESGQTIPGSVWEGGLKRNVPGGILNYSIDMTKTTGYNKCKDKAEFDSKLNYIDNE